MSESLFTVNVRPGAHDGPADTTVVDVTGEIDATNATEFQRAVRDIPARPLVVDLSALQYSDSAGFGVLDELLARDAVVIVLAPHAPMRAAARLLDLPCHDSVATAVAHVRRGERAR
jgi:anti-anti-sigma factor